MCSSQCKNLLLTTNAIPATIMEVDNGPLERPSLPQQRVPSTSMISMIVSGVFSGLMISISFLKSILPSGSVHWRSLPVQGLPPSQAEIEAEPWRKERHVIGVVFGVASRNQGDLEFPPTSTYTFPVCPNPTLVMYTVILYPKYD